MSHYYTRLPVLVKKPFLGSIYYHWIGKKLQEKWALTLPAIITVVFFLTTRTNLGGVSLFSIDRASFTDVPVPPGVNFSSFIVNTTTCKIPKLNIWDESLKVLKLKCHEEDEADPECKKKFPRDWMYSNATTLFVNESAILESGFSWRSLHCCYRVITRVEQSLVNYDEYADKVIKFSDECSKIKDLVTIIKAEFIRVFCRATTIVFSYDVVYRNYFAFPQLDKRAVEKVARWRKDSVPSLPPNVIMLMLDASSRQNFHRRLPLTLEVLHDLGAEEFFGYTKTAPNTFPNCVAFLTGMWEYDVFPRSRQTQSRQPAQDNIPYVWKEFSKAGYLTGHAEDLPQAGTFTYGKAGFVKKPVDFYFRTLMLAWLKLRCKSNSKREYYYRCVRGPQRSDELILDYVSKIMDIALDKAPVFFFSQFAAFSHKCINSMRFQDKPLSAFIRNMIKSHPNTILFLFGDHGDNYEPFSETLLGWYESRLPGMWVYLPPTIRSLHPDWPKALEINSRRLTSTFDFYHTLVHILAAFNHTVALNGKQKTGQSFFVPAPENRTCLQANISYCACERPNPTVLKRLTLKTRRNLKKVTALERSGRNLFDYFK